MQILKNHGQGYTQGGEGGLGLRPPKIQNFPNFLALFITIK